MQMPFHPAPGLGDLAPGWFALPQNPLNMQDSTVLVPTMSATAPGRWVKTPMLGDLVAGSFAVPQNPVRNNLVASMTGLRGLACGCQSGFGCDGGRDFYSLNGGLRGLGQVLGTDAVSVWLATNGGTTGQWLADETTLAGFTIPMWGWLAGGAAAAFVVSDLFSKGHAARKRYAQNPRRRVNVGGYLNSTGFHPIRSSGDYDPDRVDEYYQYAPKKKKRSKR